jgi:uncharacterized protein YjiS (DUF1127 family)
METIMRESDEFYFLRFEHRPLTPEQWAYLKQHVSRSAQRDRAQAVRTMFENIGASLQAIAGAARDLVGKWWSGYASWRERRAAVRELASLDDRTLKDLGLHRSEIESVIYGRDLERVNEGNIVAALFHKPYTGPSTGLRPRSKQLIDRSAA